MNVPSRRARARGVLLLAGLVVVAANLVGWWVDGRSAAAGAASGRTGRAALGGEAEPPSAEARPAVRGGLAGRGTAPGADPAQGAAGSVPLRVAPAPSGRTEPRGAVPHYAAEPLVGPLTDAERAGVRGALQSLDALRSLPGAAPLVDDIVAELRSGKARPRWENLPRTQAGTRRLDPDTAGQLFDDPVLGAKFQELLRIARAHGQGRSAP